MGRVDLSAVFRASQELTWSQRLELMAVLQIAQAADVVRTVVEDRLQVLRLCPHCHDPHVVRKGIARGLQRYKCRCCTRTFNALTSTPLARLRHRHRWADQGRVLVEGLSVTKAAQRLQVARSTAFRWRHRFLRLPQHIQAGHFDGIVEADETGWLKSCKGHNWALFALSSDVIRPRRPERAAPWV
jgi:transposase-like protein